MIPTQAPRRKGCHICELVASPETVTMYLIDENLVRLPLAGAIDYQREVGLTANERQLKANAIGHRRHVEKWMTEARGAIAPADPSNGGSGVIRIPAPTGPSNWLDATQQGMDVGVRALALIDQKLPLMENAELIAVAKIGQNAATTRATLEMKGAVKRMEAITALASGLRKPSEA